MIKATSALHPEQLLRSSSHHEGGTVACIICSALYAPTQTHAYLLQAPRVAMESAFMSMCRFCFRCRRPACPLCWDDVHCICGACVEEVHLPFRKEAEPLPLNSTLLLAPPSHIQAKQRHNASFPLICVFPGRFQAEATTGSGYTTEPVGVTPVVPTTQQKKARKTSAQGVAAVQEQNKLAAIMRRGERMVTILLGIVLFFSAILIVTASFSEQANTVIARLLHVDIRMEIEYLLQLIQHIH